MWPCAALGAEIALLRATSTWKHSRTRFEVLRAREPVNNGGRNKRTFSCEQLGSVLDASAQETSTSLATFTKKSTRNGAVLATPPVSLSFGSKQRLWRSADEIRSVS